MRTAIVGHEDIVGAAGGGAEVGIQLGPPQPARPVEAASANVAEVATVHAIAARPFEGPRGGGRWRSKPLPQPAARIGLGLVECAKEAAEAHEPLEFLDVLAVGDPSEGHVHVLGSGDEEARGEAGQLRLQLMPEAVLRDLADQAPSRARHRGG